VKKQFETFANFTGSSGIQFLPFGVDFVLVHVGVVGEACHVVSA
jgi:hypothetical protein